MEELVIELGRLCKASGESNTTLARRAGIDRPTLVHILAGRRRPTDAQLDALLNAMQATPAQHRALRQQFEAETVDPGLRHQRICVLHMLQKLFAMQENRISPAMLPSNAELSATLWQKEEMIFEGKARVEAALQQLLLEYCASPKGPLMLPPGMAETMLTQVSELLARCPGGGEIWHLSTFVKSTAGREEAQHNLENFSRALPFAYLNRIHYRAAFSYVQGAEPPPGLLFTDYLIFPDGLFILSKDGRNAILQRNPLVVENCRRGFQEEFRVARQFLTMDITRKARSVEILDAMSEMDQQRHLTWNLRREPQLVNFMPPETVVKYLKVPAEAAELREMVFRRVQELCNLPLTSFFTVDGLRDFLADGRLREIPDEIYYPLEKADRIALLDRLIDSCRQGTGCLHLLNPQLLNPPSGFYMVAAKDISATFSQVDVDNDRVCSFSESATVEAICDFMENLPHTDGVYTPDETLEVLCALREEAESQGDTTPCGL